MAVQSICIWSRASEHFQEKISLGARAAKCILHAPSKKIWQSESTLMYNGTHSWCSLVVNMSRSRPNTWKRAVRLPRSVIGAMSDVLEVEVTIGGICKIFVHYALCHFSEVNIYWARSKMIIKIGVFHDMRPETALCWIVFTRPTDQSFSKRCDKHRK